MTERFDLGEASVQQVAVFGHQLDLLEHDPGVAVLDVSAHFRYEDRTQLRRFVFKHGQAMEQIGD